MKKHLFAPAAAAMLVFAACSSEEVPVPVGDDGSVTFEVSLPAALGSRYGEGSVIKQLHYAVYDANNPTIGAIFASDIDGSPVAANSTIDFKLELKLVKGKTYDFIFWADAVGNDFYKFSSENKNVEITYTSAKGNDENRDAFFQAVKGVDVKGAMTMPVELRRPFAQLNFGTDDIEEAATAKTVIKSTAVKVKGVYTKLDLYGGIASDPTTVTFTSEVLPKDQTFPVDGDYDYLTMDYLLSGIELEGEGPDADVQSAKREVMDATLTFTFTDGQTADVAVLSMPVQRNYRTNVFGSLLTAAADFHIIVEPDFIEPPYNEEQGPAKVSTESALVEAIAKGGEIILANDIVLDQVLALQSSEALTIDLNGNTLSREGEGIVINMHPGTDLTINDSTDGGGVKGLNSASIIYVSEDCSLTVNGGKFVNDYNGDAALPGCIIYVNGSDASKVVINDGEFGAENTKVSCIESNGIVEINGGTFINGGFFKSPLINLMHYGSNTHACIVNGGTFGKKDFSGEIFYYGGGSLEINDGIFENGGDLRFGYSDGQEWTYEDLGLDADTWELFRKLVPFISITKASISENAIVINGGQYRIGYHILMQQDADQEHADSKIIDIKGGEWCYKGDTDILTQYLKGGVSAKATGIYDGRTVYTVK